MPVECKRCGGPNHNADQCTVTDIELITRRLRSIAIVWQQADFAGNGDYFVGKEAGLSGCADELLQFVEKIDENTS